jgi:hypothetical protein
MSEELNKAIQQAADAAVELLKKSTQLGFEFPTDSIHSPNHSIGRAAKDASNIAQEASDLLVATGRRGERPAEEHKRARDLHQKAADLAVSAGQHNEAEYHREKAAFHHTAYSRRTQSGAVSQIAAKGMQPYKSAGTAKRNMKPGDELLPGKEGGVFIHRLNPNSRTEKYELHGPKEIAKFGNKTNPRWQGLVNDGGETKLATMTRLINDGNFDYNEFETEDGQCEHCGADAPVRTASDADNAGDTFYGQFCDDCLDSAYHNANEESERAGANLADEMTSLGQRHLGDPKGLIADIVKREYGTLAFIAGNGSTEPLQLTVRHDHNMVTIGYKAERGGRGEALSIGGRPTMTGLTIQRQREAFQRIAPGLMDEIAGSGIRIEDSSIEPTTIFFVSDDMIPR